MQRESGVDVNKQRGDLGGNISKSRIFEDKKHEQEQRYAEWEKSIKTKSENELTYEEKSLREEIKSLEGK